MKVYVIVEPLKNEPGDRFIEIETADGKSVSIPFERKADGARAIGPLILPD